MLSSQCIDKKLLTADLIFLKTLKFVLNLFALHSRKITTFVLQSTLTNYDIY